MYVDTMCRYFLHIYKIRILCILVQRFLPYVDIFNMTYKISPENFFFLNITIFHTKYCKFVKTFGIKKNKDFFCPIIQKNKYSGSSPTKWYPRPQYSQASNKYSRGYAQGNHGHIRPNLCSDEKIFIRTQQF